MAEGPRSGKWIPWGLPWGLHWGRRWGLGCAALLALLALVLVGTRSIWIRALGGASRWTVLQGAESLSPEARSLLAEAMAGLDGEWLVDFHTHLAGVGDGSDCWVNPRMLSWRHPKEHLRFLIYLSAAGVDRADLGAPAEVRGGLDRAYLERLELLARAPARRGRHLLLAFDHRYDEEGRLDLDHSEFFVPNEAVWDACVASPDLFLPCVSVHPYRVDAVAELSSWAERGVRFVKWLPNAMGIDPASPRCDPFYRTMAEHGMVLITHTGLERAVEAEADQELGNPLRLRRPLGQGVRVVAAHCASTGEGRDLDHPGERASNFELFLRLMDEPLYDGLLYGDISTVTQVNRFGNALETLLRRRDLHSRLVNGSDWPLPAVNALYSTAMLRRAGFLDESEADALSELYHYSPLVFDLVLKRRVHLPGGAQRFADSVFLVPDGLMHAVEGAR